MIDYRGKSSVYVLAFVMRTNHTNGRVVKIVTHLVFQQEVTGAEPVTT